MLPDGLLEEVVVDVALAGVGNALVFIPQLAILFTLFHPVGWNWEIGVGLIGAFAAREVFVSTMGLVYGIPDADEESPSLRRRLAAARGHDGSRLFTPLSTLALLIFFTIAFQCLSTLAVLRRAFGGWRWPIGAVLLLNGVAWANHRSRFRSESVFS